MSTLQDLLTVGVNVFAGQLLAESYDKLVHLHIKRSGGADTSTITGLEFVMPSRSDSSKQVRIKLALESIGTKPHARIHTEEDPK